MASPQKENGFTPVAHEILEEVAKRKFNATQHSILLIVWRMTYGFSRRDHELAVNYFVKQTGYTKRNIQESLNQLIEQRVLVETQQASFKQTRKIAFNKNYDEWSITSRAEIKQMKKNSPHDEQFTSTGEEQNTSTGEESFTQDINNKEIYKENTPQVPLKEIESKETPSAKAGVLVKMLNEKRPARFKKFGIKGNAAANDEFAKYIKEGHSIERLLEVIRGLEEELAPWEITKQAKRPKLVYDKDEIERRKKKNDLVELYDLGLDAFVKLKYGSEEDYKEIERELEELG